MDSIKISTSNSDPEIPLPSSPIPQSSLSFPSTSNFQLPTDGFFIGNDFGMDTDYSLGLMKRNTASEDITLQSFNPSSPPRKKVRGGKRKIDSGKVKPILNLEEDNWARYFVIKKKEGSFLTDCSFKLIGSLKKLLGKTKSARKMGDGTLCIEAQNHAQAEIISSIKKVCDSDVEVGPHKRLNTSQGVVTCRDFLNSTIEDIKEGLAEEGVVDVRRIKRRQGQSLVDTASLVLTFNKPKPPTSIEAAFYKLKVRPYIPSPMRCFKCQMFGHTSQRCKAPEQLCICGKPSHEGECVPPIVCINCGEDHNARSPNCPVLHEEKEIQKVKTLQQLPYHEAKAIVKSKSFVNPAVSFAEKTRRPDISKKVNPSTASDKNETGLTPAQGGTSKKVVSSPPPKSSPSGGNVADRLQNDSSTESGGIKEVELPPPQNVIPPEDGWRVVPPRSAALGGSDKKLKSPPRPSRPKGGKTKTIPGDSRITRSYYIRRSPRPKWELLGTDLEASESEGGRLSDRQLSRRKKKEKPAALHKKTFTD